MFCKICGTEQKQGQIFCPNCGTPFGIVNYVEGEQVSSDNEEEYSDSYYDGMDDQYSQYEQPPHTNPFPLKWVVPIACLVAIIGLAIWGWNKISFNDKFDIFTSYVANSSIDGIPFKSSVKGKWGMLKPDGTILFEDEFKDEPTVAHEGRFFVKNGNGLWEIFTAEEKPQKVGDEYVSLGEFYNGVAPAVKKNERISLIDKQGNVIAVLDKSGSKPITKMENFHYGYALFEADDAVGIVNTRGEMLLDARKYCKIYHVAPKRFLALDMRYKDETDLQNYVFDIIDPVGNRQGTLRMAKYNDIVVLDDGYIGIEQTSDGEKLYGIIDLDGNVLVKPSSKTKGLYGYMDGKYIFSDGEYWGVRSVEDKVLIRAKYDAIKWATSDMIWGVSVNDDGKAEMSLVDLEGNKITQDTYQDALPFFDGKHAFVQITDKTWGMINYKGEEMKDVPDIYTVECNSADAVIVSDYVDIDAVISAVKMTPYGFGGFGIYMHPTDLIKVYNENCERGKQLELNPSTTHIDQLSYDKDVLNGIRLNVNLYYTAYITERGNSHYDEAIGEWIQEPDTWTKEAPQYIKMTITGSKLSGKSNLIYKKLAAKAKTYGKIYKENDHACIVISKDKRGMVLVDTGSEVWGMVKSADSILGENIEQYSNMETRRGDYVEEVDSIEEVFDY